MGIKINPKTISQTAKKISGKPLGVASKAIGVATLASVLYDAHVNGKEKAYTTDSLEYSEKYLKNLDNYATLERNSATLAKLKGIWFNIQQNMPFRHSGLQIKGYCKGFGETLINNLPNIGLGIAALKFKNLGKVAGVILGVFGIHSALYDVGGLKSKK